MPYPIQPQTSIPEQQPRLAMHAEGWDLRRSVVSVEDLSRMQIDQDMIDYTIHFILRVAARARLDGGTWPAESTLEAAYLGDFVGSILRQSAAPVTALFASLIFMDKITPPLPSHWSYERIFFGALLLASKGPDVDHPDIPYWAHLTGVFSANNVATIGNDFRRLIKYKVTVRNDDILKYYSAFQEFRGSPHWPDFPPMDHPAHSRQPATACPQKRGPNTPLTSHTFSALEDEKGRHVQVALVEAAGSSGRHELAEATYGPQLAPFRYPAVADRGRLPPIEDLLRRN